MALKMNQMKCPSCGANLEFDGERDKVFCTYCGTPIVITDENRKEIVRRVVDEAAIAQEHRKEREAELRDQFFQREDRKKRNMWIGFGIVCLIYLIIVIIYLLS